MVIPRKKDIEIVLSRLEPLPSPKVELEQYSTPPSLAAEMLYIASFIYNDVYGRRVLDLGTGSGRLAIGASLIGAREVVGVDIDLEAIKLAYRNAKLLDADVEWIASDIEAVRGSFDTVIMNPPFGTRRRHGDIIFLSKAMEVARVIYTLHKRSTRRYLIRFIELKKGLIDKIIPMEFEIPHTFNFHRKRKYKVEVDFYRIIM